MSAVLHEDDEPLTCPCCEGKPRCKGSLICSPTTSTDAFGVIYTGCEPCKGTGVMCCVEPYCSDPAVVQTQDGPYCRRHEENCRCGARITRSRGFRECPRCDRSDPDWGGF